VGSALAAQRQRAWPRQPPPPPCCHRAPLRWRRRHRWRQQWLGSRQQSTINQKQWRQRRRKRQR
jgi:hypothetical protein